MLSDLRGLPVLLIGSWIHFILMVLCTPLSQNLQTIGFCKYLELLSLENSIPLFYKWENERKPKIGIHTVNDKGLTIIQKKETLTPYPSLVYLYFDLSSHGLSLTIIPPTKSISGKNFPNSPISSSTWWSEKNMGFGARKARIQSQFCLFLPMGPWGSY